MKICNSNGYAIENEAIFSAMCQNGHATFTVEAASGIDPLKIDCIVPPRENLEHDELELHSENVFDLNKSAVSVSVSDAMPAAAQVAATVSPTSSKLDIRSIFRNTERTDIIDVFQRLDDAREGGIVDMPKDIRIVTKVYWGSYLLQLHGVLTTIIAYCNAVSMVPSIEGTLPRFSSPAPYYCIPHLPCAPLLERSSSLHWISVGEYTLFCSIACLTWELIRETTVIGFAFSVPEHGRDLKFWYLFLFCFLSV